MKCTIINQSKTAKRIKFTIPYKAKKWRARIKQIPTIHYHKSQRAWSILACEQYMTQLIDAIGKQHIVYARVSNICVPTFEPSEYVLQHLDRFETKIILAGYAQSTIKTYRAGLIYFFKYFEGRDILQVTKTEIEAYLATMIMKYKMSESKQNSTINAIKYYYEKVMDQPKAIYNIQRPKKSRTLPNVIPQRQIMQLINAPKNLKHRCILWLLYTAGLRKSELLNIRIEDIRSKEGYIFIKASKGKKDRRTVLSPHTFGFTKSVL